MKEVYDSHWYVLGKYLKNFEENFNAYNQVKHCVGVANGLGALQVSLKVLGIGPRDEVIVPAHTYLLPS